MIVRRLPVLVALAVSLAGCGTLTQDNANVALVRQLVPQILGRQAATEPALAGEGQQGLTRAAVEASPVPLLLASVVGSGTVTLMQQTGTNGGEATFTSDAGASATFEDGGLVATRGLGPDLMGAEVSGTLGALRAGGGEARRVHDYIDGLDRIVRREYACRIAPMGPATIEVLQRRHETTRFDETCVAGAVRFTNTYWIDPAGVVRKSRQLVSPPLGYLDTETL